MPVVFGGGPRFWNPVKTKINLKHLSARATRCTANWSVTTRSFARSSTPTASRHPAAVGATRAGGDEGPGTALHGGLDRFLPFGDSQTSGFPRPSSRRVGSPLMLLGGATVIRDETISELDRGMASVAERHVVRRAASAQGHAVSRLVRLSVLGFDAHAAPDPERAAAPKDRVLDHADGGR
jgi:hypothetical protein